MPKILLRKLLIKNCNVNLILRKKAYSMNSFAKFSAAINQSIKKDNLKENSLKTGFLHVIKILCGVFSLKTTLLINLVHLKFKISKFVKKISFYLNFLIKYPIKMKSSKLKVKIWYF